MGRACAANTKSIPAQIAMSKILAPIPTVLAAFLLILQFFTFVDGQDVQLTIKITAEAPFSADVKGTFGPYRKSSNDYLWLLDEYAGMSGLAKRFSFIQMLDDKGLPAARWELLGGERRNIAGFSGFAYSVDLTHREIPFAAAHLSWVNENDGVLLLDDLLPQSLARTARIRLELPDGWTASSSDYINSMEQTTPTEQELNNLSVADVEKGVILIGRGVRQRVVWVGRTRLVLNFRDEWLFSADESVNIAASIFTEYEKMFGTASTGNFLIGLKKFPNPTALGNWEGDTRGRSITIVSSDMPFRNQSVQRLHEQLRHEMFHLWIPNGVNLSGNYDWFYEGFALYQSLKLGVAVNRISFEDFLASLGGAYDIEVANPTRVSLVDLSKNRWKGTGTQVYARGMLVAFVCDIAMLNGSNGKLSVTDLIKEVIAKHGLATPKTDGNAALIGLFKSHREIAPVVDRYITGGEPFAIENALVTAGIETDRNSQPTKFKPLAKPSSRQKNLLEKLGIHNWRKSGKLGFVR